MFFSSLLTWIFSRHSEDWRRSLKCYSLFVNWTHHSHEISSSSRSLTWILSAHLQWLQENTGIRTWNVLKIRGCLQKKNSDLHCSILFRPKSSMLFYAKLVHYLLQALLGQISFLGGICSFQAPAFKIQWILIFNYSSLFLEDVLIDFKTMTCIKCAHVSRQTDASSDSYYILTINEVLKPRKGVVGNSGFIPVLNIRHFPNIFRH